MATTQRKHGTFPPPPRRAPGPVQAPSPSPGGGHCSLPHAHLSGYADGDHSVLLLEVGLEDVTLQANGGPIPTWREEQSGSQVYPGPQIVGTTGQLTQQLQTRLELRDEQSPAHTAPSAPALWGTSTLPFLLNTLTWLLGSPSRLHICGTILLSVKV